MTETESKNKRDRGTEKSLSAKTTNKVKTIVYMGNFFLHKNTKVCKEYVLRAAYFSQTGFGLFLQLFVGIGLHRHQHGLPEFLH